MFAVKARDFVIARGFEKMEGGMYMTIGKSMPVPQIPEKKEFVR